MVKHVFIFWGIKIANFFQEVLKSLGSYMRVFTVIARALLSCNREEEMLKVMKAKKCQLRGGNDE